MLRALAHLAVYLAVLALALSFMRRVAAPGGGDILGSKLQHYLAEPERYDTVFLGSSHVYRAFVPEVFDARLGASGVPSSSFNLGVQYPHQLELEYLARAVLEAGRGRLRRLLIEYVTLMPQVDPDNAFHSRAVYWHDWPATSLALERTRGVAEATPGGIPLVTGEDEHSVLGEVERLLPSWWAIDRVHLQHWAKRELLIARGPDVLKGLLGRAHGQTGEWARNRGYLSLEEDERRMGARGNADNSIRRRREAFLADLDGYAAEVRAVASEPRWFGDGEWVNAELLQVHDLAAYHAMAAAARREGVELVVVVMPSSNCDRPAEERLGAELGVPVLRFNRPQEFPELYSPELRYDSGHINEAGAVAFTELLARHWLGLPGQE